MKPRDSESIVTATDVSLMLSKPLPPLPQQSKTSWRSLFAFTARGHSHVLLGAVLASLAVAALQTILAIILGRIFEIVAGLGNGVQSGHEALEAVSRWCLVLLGLGFANWFSNSVFLGLWVAFGEMQADAGRRRVFESLLAKDMAWFDRLEQGMSGLLSRIQTQTRELQSATAQVLGFLVCDMLVSCASLTVAMFYSWKLTLVLLATLPPSIMALSLATRQLDSAIQSQKACLERATKLARASLAAIDVVKVFNGSNRELRQYRDALGLARAHYLVQARCNSVQMGYIAFWVVSLFIIGFWYGVVLVRDGLSPGHVVTTFYSTLAAFQAAEALGSNWLILSKGVAAGSFLSGIVQDEKPVEADGRRFRLEHCVGDVQFTDVSFAYPSNPAKKVLEQASFTFPAGQTTFVVGKSGCGKSTVGSLLANFYQPLSGNILIDGQPLEQFDASWVRENITLIQQESLLFRDSLYNNVTLGKPNACKEEVLAACQAALLQSTVASLPRGLETEVGPGGVALSGGQKQKVALARAYLKNSTILVLDEVTSDLDQVSRSLVMDAIRQWRRDKTTIIVTHDVSCIDGDDYVYVMDDATVACQGFKRDLNDLGWPKAATEIDNNPPADSVNPPDRSAPRSSMGGSLLSPLRTGHRMSLRISPARALFPDRGVRPLTSLDDPGSNINIHNSSIDGDDDNDDGSPLFVFGAAERRKGISILRQAACQQRPTTAAEEGEGQQDRSQPKHASLLSILGTIWPRLKAKERLTLILGLIICSVAATATPAFAFCLSRLMSVMWSSGDKLVQGRQWALLLTGVAITDGLCTGLGRYLLELVAQSWTDGIRTQAMASILKQKRPWFDGVKHAPSRLAECLERNAEEMRNVVGRFLAILVFVSVIMTLSILWALVVDWRLSLVALAPLPLTLAAVRGYATVSGEWERRCNDAAEESSAMATETLIGIRLVRALDLSARQTTRYQTSAIRTRSLGMARARRTSCIFGLYQSMGYALSALVFYYGTRRLTSATVDVAAVLHVITLLLFAIGTSSEMLDGLPQLTLAQAAAGPLLDYAALPKPRRRLQQLVSLPLRFHNLVFSYPASREPILGGLSLEIRPGESIAIVGPSGCGKSTLLSLILGLYPPTRPALGTALVPQSPTVFPATISENILYGLPSNSPLRKAGSLEAASQAAGVHAFASSLPQGYATPVGDGGQTLSGGQAQRLAIARALVRCPQLLVMDEPTSALDAESAKRVRHAMRVVAGLGAAVVVATHCPYMMRAADRVVVLGRGVVVEQGRFQDLVRKGGALSHLVSGGQWNGERAAGDCS
ncbi:hypothetical protein XA68_14055 [Ophiocordyceps unilateralis]|uniref:ABC transporter domain-containing protein n=1 Tax=Ophiocordyceps unilateralis TaxID=268505 RepID=A0A2A9PLU1_OPHUN|nr:hypothetical protein XA68_14055 [Ophiocordyceps unilateralis]